MSQNANYRSLQKSKRSIKTIEKTLKNSKSIEKWLNEYDDNYQNVSTSTSKTGNLTQSVSSSVVPPDTIIEESKHTNLLVFPNESMDSLFDPTTISTSSKDEKIATILAKDMPSKLAQRLEKMLNLNRIDCVRTVEAEMHRFVRNLILPKSMVNLEDITFLKWLLTDNNFKLYVQQPVQGMV